MVKFMGTSPYRKAKNLSVYQALMLMVAFATLVLALNNKDKK